MKDTEEGDAIVQKVQGGKGAENAGGTMLLYLNNSAMKDLSNAKIWEPMQHENIDSFYDKIKEDSKRNIYERFQQPSIINGRADSGMFNAQSMEDAFD